MKAIFCPECGDIFEEDLGVWLTAIPYLKFCSKHCLDTFMEDKTVVHGIVPKPKENRVTMDSEPWPPQYNDVAFLNGTVYVYCERPLDRNPWVPVNQSGKGPSVTNEQMQDAQLLVRAGDIVKGDKNDVD